MVEHCAVTVDGGGDVAHRDIGGIPLRRLDDLVRREVLGDDLALLALADHGVGQLVAALLEHPRDEPVELGQCLGRIGAEIVLERLPLALPLVPVESGFVHGRVLRGRHRLQTHTIAG